MLPKIVNGTEDELSSLSNATLIQPSENYTNTHIPRGQKKTIKVAYLTALRGLDKDGLSISGAIQYALEQVFIMPSLSIFTTKYRSSWWKNLNLPEAIRNLATPLATPRSDRPGSCNVNGHTTVCQTGVFFFQS